MTPIPPAQLLDALHWRYATQLFDANRKIPADLWHVLEQTLVLTPSSYGLQPWKFIVVTDPSLRQALLPLSYHQRQVVDASHLVVLTVKKHFREEDIDRFTHRIAEVRGGTADALTRFKQSIMRDLIHGSRASIITEWATRQAYIALGQFIAAASLLGIDTCPMEGFRPGLYDELLELPATGYTSVLLCPAGYRSEEDRYAHLPKVRYAETEMIEHR